MIPVKKKQVRIFVSGIQQALCKTTLAEHTKNHGVVRIGFANLICIGNFFPMINQFMINRLILSARRAEKSIPRCRFFLPVFRQKKQDPQIILPSVQNTGNLYRLILNAAEQEIVSAEQCP